MCPNIPFVALYVNFILWCSSVSALSSRPEKCLCQLTKSVPTNAESHSITQLKCKQSAQDQNGIEHVPCYRYDSVVRIGPLPHKDSNEPSVNRTSALALEPWAFSDLFTSKDVTTLQLDLNSANTGLDALILGGLENVRQLLGRNSVVRWDGCSFANMKHLEQVVLNCNSNFQKFLALGPNIRVVRFVDCEYTSLQFRCISCQQDPDYNVIRISPGPPLGQYMIKFSQFPRNLNESAIIISEFGRFSIGACVPTICSDEALCRNNEALKVSMELTHSLRGTTQMTPKPLQSPYTEGSYVSGINPNNSTPMAILQPPVMSQKLLAQTHQYHIWLTLAVLCLVVIFLTALGFGMMALIKRKVGRSRHEKRNGNRQQPVITPVGVPPGLAVNGIDERTKLELSERSPPVEYIQASLVSTLESDDTQSFLNCSNTLDAECRQSYKQIHSEMH